MATRVRRRVEAASQGGQVDSRTVTRLKANWQGSRLVEVSAPGAGQPGPKRLREPAAARAYAQRALVVDAVMLALVAILIEQVSPTVRIPPEPLVWAAAYPIVVIALFYLRGMYSPPMRLDQLQAVRLVISGSALAAMVVMTARAVFADGPWVAAENVRHWLIALPFLAAGRCGLMWFETRARRDGASSRRTLIVGSGQVARLTAKRLLDQPELGLVPIGFLDDDPPPADSSLPLVPVLDSRAGFDAVLRDNGVTHVIVAFSTASDAWLLAFVRRCWQLGVTVSVVPRLFEVHGEDVVLEHVGNLPLMDLRPANPHGLQFKLKYALDRVAAAVALAVLSPLLAATALAVLTSIGRPVLYRQRRVGRDGSEFDMLKFRTMSWPAGAIGHADADWAAAQLGVVRAEAMPVAHVPRVGALLRRFSIDELPQLWNVLRGEMSLIGPRPERVDYVQHFEQGIYRYEDRHRVKSGLTGWAQVHNLRGRTSLADRVEWDNHYIENWSLWMDLKIALMTIPCLIRGRGE